MLAIIPSQKEIVDKKPLWEVRFMSTSEAREVRAAKHPGQSGHLGQLRFLVQSYVLQNKFACLCSLLPPEQLRKIFTL